MAAPWDEIFRKYDRNDLSFRNAFMASAYKSIYEASNEPEDLAYFASFICGIAVTFRENGIDLTSLTVRTESPPRADIDALMSTLRAIDEMIEEVMEFISRAADTDPRVLDGHAMMRALFIWKGYLSAINVPPEAWTDVEVCALRSLWILTTVDSADVIKRLRDGAHASVGTFSPDIRRAVQETDWPPRGFIDLYFQNHGLLENRCRAIFGTFE
jgi:hypothetical protein